MGSRCSGQRRIYATASQIHSNITREGQKFTQPTPTPSSFVSCSGKRAKEGTEEEQERREKSNKRGGEKGEGQAVRKANMGCNKRRRKGTRSMESKGTTG